MVDAALAVSRQRASRGRLVAMGQGQVWSSQKAPDNNGAAQTPRSEELWRAKNGTPCIKNT